MKIIPLTQGKVTIVDDKDYDWLTQWEWHAAFINGKWYAGRNQRVGPKKYKTIYMHIAIMRSPRKMHVDHRDGNGLNNQKYNLRICTPAQNLVNRGPNKNNKTGYKGVGWSGGKYTAHVKINGRYTSVGRYATAEEAAHAVDTKTKEVHGEFAWLNFPE